MINSKVDLYPKILIREKKKIVEFLVISHSKKKMTEQTFSPLKKLN